MIARAGENGYRVAVTGIGAYAPERVLTNEDLARMVNTSDEWIVERTGIRDAEVLRVEEPTGRSRRVGEERLCLRRWPVGVLREPHAVAVDQIRLALAAGGQRFQLLR